jgi:hypothetical protein
MPTLNQPAIANTVVDLNPNVILWANHFRKCPKALHDALVAAMGEEYDQEPVNDTVVQCLVLDFVNDDTTSVNHASSDSERATSVTSSVQQFSTKTSAAPAGGNTSQPLKHQKIIEVKMLQDAALDFSNKHQSDSAAVNQLNQEKNM